jgi:hypothetical protein
MTEWQDGDEVTTTFGSIRQGMLEAAEAERERIIALLETEVWDSPEIATPYVRHIIALIKGKNE